MAPSRIYRNYLRDIRMILSPAEEGVLAGELISNMRMEDLEALYELVTGADPRSRAPTDYQSRH